MTDSRKSGTVGEPRRHADWRYRLVTFKAFTARQHEPAGGYSLALTGSERRLGTVP